ncbi:hypothetical protein HDU99_002898 [Rhizoclosmatium hyalinum]|nr:hypothetical protein HDU99_002898 [Rhizoclosmatium hyalinum]
MSTTTSPILLTFVYPTQQCGGGAVFGTSASPAFVPAGTGAPNCTSGSPESGKFTCLGSGTPYAISTSCSNMHDVQGGINGAVFGLSMFTEEGCGKASTVATVAASLYKCINIPQGGSIKNLRYTVINGTVEATEFRDKECTVPAELKGAVDLPQCGKVLTAKNGTCVNVPAECATAFADKFNGVKIGSYLYEIPYRKESASRGVAAAVQGAVMMMALLFVVV